MHQSGGIVEMFERAWRGPAWLDRSLFEPHGPHRVPGFAILHRANHPAAYHAGRTMRLRRAGGG